MKNRLVSLFELDDLLAAGTNGHNGSSTKKRAHKKKCRKAATSPTVAKAPGTTQPSGTPPASTPVAKSFDTGGAIHCDHAVPYPTTPKIELPVEAPAAPPAPAPHAQSFGIEVEAFEDDGEDDNSMLTISRDEENPLTLSESLGDFDAEPYTPPVDRPDAEEPAEVQPSQASSFTAQMSAVEADLAELAERVTHPPPNSTPPTPPSEDEQADTTSRASSRGHAIFDTMAKGMNYATEFRLPAVQLSQVFSALDRELDAESIPGTPASPAPVAVTPTPAMPDGDVLLADLVKLSPPSPPAPPSQPQPQPVVNESTTRTPE